MIQFNDNGGMVGDIPFQRMFASDGFTNSYRIDLTVIDAPGEIVIDDSHFPEVALQHLEGAATQLFSIVYAQ